MSSQWEGGYGQWRSARMTHHGNLEGWLPRRASWGEPAHTGSHGIPLTSVGVETLITPGEMNIGDQRQFVGVLIRVEVSLWVDEAGSTRVPMSGEQADPNRAVDARGLANRLGAPWFTSCSDSSRCAAG